MSLEPQHHLCSWSRRRLTEISLSGGVLGGAGAGIRTFLFALADSDRVWYAAELDADNAVFLTLAPGSEDAGGPPSRPLLPEELRERLGIEERAIGDGLRRRLDLELTPGRATVGSPGPAKHVIELHDDCFFRYATRDPAGLEKVLGGILAQHGAYLGRPGPAAVAPELLRLLRVHGVLRLQSIPAAARIRVLARVAPRLRRWLRPWARVGAVEHSGAAWSFVPSSR